MIHQLLSTRSAQVLGIEMREDGLALALATRNALSRQPAELDFLPGSVPGIPTNALKHWVEARQCARADCHLVLNSSDYQLLLVEAPDVPEEELSDALRWRLRDLLNISPDQATVDYFFLPEDGSKSQTKMCYVVAADTDRIQLLVDWIGQSGLTLRSIDIGELALSQLNRVIAANDGFSESSRARVMVRVAAGAGEILIFRQNFLYLARSFSLGYLGGEKDPLPAEQLVLEIQRSIDYFERQMGQTPPISIDLCGTSLNDKKINDEMKSAFSIALRVIDMNAIWPSSDPIEQGLIQSCAGAIGVLFKPGDKMT